MGLRPQDQTTLQVQGWGTDREGTNTQDSAEEAPSAQWGAPSQQGHCRILSVSKWGVLNRQNLPHGDTRGQLAGPDVSKQKTA